MNRENISMLGIILSPFLVTLVAVIVILFASILILCLPYCTIVTILGRRAERKFQEGYADFLRKNNGRRFFTYTSRKNSAPVIEKDILPKLSKHITVIYLNEKIPESDQPQEYISRMLYGLKELGYPNIMKIKNEIVYDKSLKNSFYRILNQNKPMETFLEEIEKAVK